MLQKRYEYILSIILLSKLIEIATIARFVDKIRAKTISQVNFLDDFNFSIKKAVNTE